MPRRFLLFLLVLCSFVPAHAQSSQPHKMRTRVSRASGNEDQPLRFLLWEKQSDLHKRAGIPKQYFVSAIQKVIRPDELRYYSDNYGKVDDVFYRNTSAGEVRILVAYARDESQGHLNPEVRVEKVHFFFDKDITLRKALASILELRELCAGGCILNGFSSSVVAQPASPSDAQIALAHQMKPHWRGQDMSDATPGAEVFYVDSPYSVDFEHSPVERIDYTLAMMNKQPTVSDVWHPRISDPGGGAK